MIAQVAHRNVVRILREMMQPDGESLGLRIWSQVAYSDDVNRAFRRI